MSMGAQTPLLEFVVDSLVKSVVQQAIHNMATRKAAADF